MAERTREETIQDCIEDMLHYGQLVEIYRDMTDEEFDAQRQWHTKFERIWGEGRKRKRPPPGEPEDGIC